jgi:hypothetical protein
MSVRILILSSVLISLVAVAPRPAHAQDPNRVFAGRIITAHKRFPTYAKSQNQYIHEIKKLSKRDFFEDKKDHTWMVYFAAFLRAPLNDVEYKLKFYELKGHGQQLIATSDQFTDTRGERTIISKIKLDKNMVGVNKELLMTLENHGNVLASGRLRIIGEGEHFSGKVDFSSDDAK